MPVAQLPVLLTDALARQAADSPDALAFWTPDRQLTYAGLEAAAAGVAGALATLDPSAPHRLGLLCGHGAGLTVALLGVLKSGHTCVPLDVSHPAARLREVLENAEASAVLTDTAHLPGARAAAGEAGLVVNVDEVAPITPAPAPRPIPPDTLAAILYTSGSTGRPKGVMHTHGTLAGLFAGSARLSGLTPGDRVALLNSCTTMTGQIDLFGALLNGATVCPYDLRQQGLAGLAAWLTTSRITYLTLVPSVWRHFARQLPPALQFPALRRLRLVGETVTARDVAHYRAHLGDGATFVVTYGSTERPAMCRLVLHHGSELAGDLVPVGATAEDFEVFVADDDLRSLPAGEVGQIVARGAHVSPGYWRDPAETARVYPPDPAAPQRRLYLTGDVGFLRDDGCLVHLGRRDRQVKVHGNRVELAEIEAALLCLPEVQEGVTLAWDAPGDDRRLAAYVVPAADASLEPADVRRALRRRLPGVMVPADIVMLEALPRLPGGKVDRAALPRPPRTAPGSSPDPSLTPTQQAVAAVWAEVREDEPPALTDDFFLTGGDSMQAVGLLAGIEQRLGRRIPLPALLEHPTVEHLAALVDEAAGEAPAVALPGQVRPGVWGYNTAGRQPPCFWIPGDRAEDVNIFRCGVLAQHMGPDFPWYVLAVRDREGAGTRHAGVAALAADCVRRVREIQPRGPYRLGAICLGGAVAIEMARRLTEDHETIARLVLINSWAPMTLRPYAMTRPDAVAHRTLQSLRRLREISPGEWGRYLRAKGAAVAELVRRRRRPADRGRDDYLRMIADHDLRPYEGPVTLLAADEDYHQDARLGWDPAVLPRLTVVRLPGGHTDWLEAQVADTAARLRETMAGEVAPRPRADNPTGEPIAPSPFWKEA